MMIKINLFYGYISWIDDSSPFFHLFSWSYLLSNRKKKTKKKRTFLQHHDAAIFLVEHLVCPTCID